jgi:hypothetical protein
MKRWRSQVGPQVTWLEDSCFTVFRSPWGVGIGFQPNPFLPSFSGFNANGSFGFNVNGSF